MTKRFLLAAMLVGCVDGESFDETSQEVASTNGVSLNGVSLNGVSLNGVSLNGVSLNGVSLNGVSLNGVSLNGVSLDGSSLTGVRSDTGESLTVGAVGTTMTGLLSNGATIQLTVERATQLAGANSDVWSYGISYPSDGGTRPLCGDPAIGALAVAGTWNATAAYSASTSGFTFACRGMTIAKCVELGYKPWRGYATQLQSCVRMLRGDYCGDGVAYTQTGQRLNLYDNLGIQVDTEQWVAEAEWTPNGARCISSDFTTRFEKYGFPKPSCLTYRQLSVTRGCGQSFKSGAILISEIPIEDINNVQVDPAYTSPDTLTITTDR